MAARKKRGAAPTKSNAGRKKEIKRFELEIADHGSECNLLKNEIAFVVRTSGGTSLNTTDIGKLHRLLQHELRRLGHKLKRKGQELDPEEGAPPENSSESAEPSGDAESATTGDAAPGEDAANLPPDPDDSDAHTDLPTPQ